MDNTTVIEKILGFMKEAGEIAVKNQQDISLFEKGRFKNEDVFSIVTKTDLAISNLFKETIEQEFSGTDYLIVDEETIAEIGDDPAEKIKLAPIALIIDPIDGTLTYSKQMPEYGISVGVLEFGRPRLGAIYLPATKELVYCDGKNSFWVRDAFLPNEKKIELDGELYHGRGIVFNGSWSAVINRNLDLNKDCIADFYSAVVHFLYIATGRAKGCYFKVLNIWDFAGAWAILQNLGVDFINVKTEEALKELSLEAFVHNTTKTKDVYVVCCRADFEYLKSIIDIREWDNDD